PPFNFKDAEGNHLFDTVEGHMVRADILRSILASDGDALISALYSPSSSSFNLAMNGLFTGDAPLGLGYTAGEGFQYGINNVDGGVQDEPFGDPTVRMSIVKPVDTSTTPVAETLDISTGAETISWQPSPDHTLSGFHGYNVYESASADGPFTLVNTSGY